MRQIGIKVFEVSEQMSMDPRFPTVLSPNPENQEALNIGIKLAKKKNVDVLFGTDPDSDRMGVAVRTKEGFMKLLSGNIIGSLLLDFRIKKMKALGLLPKKGSSSAVLIKSFVTTPLQETIANNHGIRCVNTLTGFKWIGKKLNFYEKKLIQKIGKYVKPFSYNSLSHQQRLRLMLKHSAYLIFGSEESYGYLSGDSIRDKDGNMAILMFCELIADLKARKKTVADYLNEIYLENGYFFEDSFSINYSGSEGLKKIKNILVSYRKFPPSIFNGIKIKFFQDFGVDKVVDIDGHILPKQDFYFIHLVDGSSYAVRQSGTEPKIKFYFFGRNCVSKASELKSVKQNIKSKIIKLCFAVKNDAYIRALN